MRSTPLTPPPPPYRPAGGPRDVPTLDAVLARSTPAAVLVEGPTRRKGAEVEARVAELAGGLQAQGIKRRDVVAWQLPNVIEAALLYRACWRIGAVAAPVHHHAGRAEVERMLSAVEPKAFFADRNEVRGVAGPPVEAPPRAPQPRGIPGGVFTAGPTRGA